MVIGKQIMLKNGKCQDEMLLENNNMERWKSI